MLSVDDIDTAPRCIGMRWHRTSGEESRVQSGKDFGLISVDTIHGLVHLLRADFGMKSLCDYEERRGNLEGLRNGEDGWPSEDYYVNRI